MEKIPIPFCKVLSFVVFNLFCISLYAQDDTLSSKSEINRLLQFSFEELVEMPVSSASKIGQKVSEAPSIVSVVTNDQMKKYGWYSLNDIAYKQAGFTPGQDRFNQVIQSRGISDLLWSKRLLVLFDGVPFSSFQSTVTDQALSLNMAKSVEIVRGPGAVLYGSQALTGVLQVNSLSYSNLKGNGEAEVRIGSNGMRNIDVLTGVGGENFNTLISFNNFMSEGNEYNSFDALLKRDASGRIIKQRTQDEKSSSHFWTKLEGNDKLEGLSFSYHLQNYNFQMGHGFLTVIPEREESSNVTRNYFLTKYVTPAREGRKLIQEYVLKYDYEVSDFKMQVIPTGFTTIRYPGTDSSYVDSSFFAGWRETYIVPVNSFFARSQWIYFFNNSISLLGGIEQDVVYYAGDKSHYSNINLNSPGFKPFSKGAVGPIGPVYESIKGRPINNTGIYFQLSADSIFDSKFSITVGGRLDMYYYKYQTFVTKIDTSRFVNHFSPRIVLVYSAKENLSFKAIYGHAFRMASPFEQFLTNSIITGAGRRDINPEIINTVELSGDWTINKRANWRNTLFYSIFKDQIRSTRRGNPKAASVFDNVIRTDQAGFESEINFFFSDFSSFANYSFVQRLSETSNDTLIKTNNSLVWYPSHSINAGITYTYKKTDYTVQGHYQSMVDRREVEKGAPKTGINAGLNYDNLRGATVDAWFSMDININYHISEKLQARLSANNVLDNEYHLINILGGTSPQPFDYQQMGRRIMVSLKIFL